MPASPSRPSDELADRGATVKTEDREIQIVEGNLLGEAQYFTGLIYKKVIRLSAEICCEPTAAILRRIHRVEDWAMDVEWRAFSRGQGSLFFVAQRLCRHDEIPGRQEMGGGIRE